MSPQRTIAHYHIIAKLGGGGMGQVWRATDTKLGREWPSRFRPRASPTIVNGWRASAGLASLNHPNMAAITSPTVTMSETRIGAIMGTPAYMSPEQARGQNVDKRADIWFIQRLGATPPDDVGNPFPSRQSSVPVVVSY